MCWLAVGMCGISRGGAGRAAPQRWDGSVSTGDRGNAAVAVHTVHERRKAYTCCRPAFAIAWSTYIQCLDSLLSRANGWALATSEAMEAPKRRRLVTSNCHVGNHDLLHWRFIEDIKSPSYHPASAPLQLRSGNCREKSGCSNPMKARKPTPPPGLRSANWRAFPSSERPLPSPSICRPQLRMKPLFGNSTCGFSSIEGEGPRPGVAGCLGQMKIPN